MAVSLAYVDRVKETTTTTGTGNITTAGAATRCITFNTAYGTNVRFKYVIEGQSSSTEWEVGIGYLSGATTLVRETVLASSNSGSAVNFSAGTKDVFSTVGANEVKQLQSRGRGYATLMGRNLT